MTWLLALGGSRHTDTTEGGGWVFTQQDVSLWLKVPLGILLGALAIALVVGLVYCAVWLIVSALREL